MQNEVEALPIYMDAKEEKKEETQILVYVRNANGMFSVQSYY